MKIIKSIYDAPYTREPNMFDDDNYTTIISIKHNNQTYVGRALLHPEDEDFYSSKVGFNIALSRARIEALKSEYHKISAEYEAKLNFYNQVTGHGEKDVATIDPTLSFQKNLANSKYRAIQIEDALKQEKKQLQMYLKGQERFIESIKKIRQADKNN